MAKGLTAAAIRKYAPSKTKRRVFHDSDNLFLVVSPSGRKSFQMRFTRPNGRTGKMVLGPWHSGEETEGTPVVGMPLTLRQARELAQRILRERELGKDPIADHKAKKHRIATELAEREKGSYPAAVEAYAKDIQKRLRTWRETVRLLGVTYNNDGDAETLKGGLAERWRDRPLAEIDSADIWAVVEEGKKNGIPGLAARGDGSSDSRARALYAALSSFFGWALRHRRIASNPAKEVARPRPVEARDRVLSADEVKKFWSASESLPQVYSSALKLLLITGQRRNEVAQMRRSELSDDGKTWTIPGSRTKNKRDHKVPLSPLARELVESADTDGEFVFSNDGKSPAYLGSKIKAALDAHMKLKEPWRLHDLRRTACTMMGDLGISADLIELCVNHISGVRAGVAGTYNRSERLEERRVALERLAKHVLGLVSEKKEAKVVALKRGRK